MSLLDLISPTTSAEKRKSVVLALAGAAVVALVANPASAALVFIVVFCAALILGLIYFGLQHTTENSFASVSEFNP